MARLIATIVVLGLLGGTAAAFAITEGFKLERSPITGTRITSAFSPGCDCPAAVAHINFRLRKPDSVTATILGPDGSTVQTIASDLAVPRGFLGLTWDGKNDLGQVVPPGGYKVRVHLAERHQTITLPNTITVDKTPPRIRVTRVRPRLFSPDRDRRRDHVAIRFSVSETAGPLLYVNGRLTLRGRLTDVSGTLFWSGRVGGRKLTPGMYALTLRAEDVAGNRSPRSRPHRVVLRYVTLGRRILRVRGGSLFPVRVSSDARRLVWRLADRSGVFRPGRRKIRAPKKRGRYRLVVEANGARAAATVVVRRAAR